MRFPSAAVMVGRHGPGGGDGRAGSVVLGRGGDVIGGGRGGSGVASMVDEEQDSSVLRRGGEVRVDNEVLEHGDDV
jgi:hypothetical protein